MYHMMHKGWIIIPFVVLAIVGSCRSTTLPGSPNNGPRPVAGPLVLSVWPRELTVTGRQKAGYTVQVILTNNGDSSVYVRRGWHVSVPGVGARTPLVVRVQDSHGRPLDYMGPVFKLAKIQADSFVLLGLRRCYGTAVNLDRLFPGLRTPGSYTVWFRYQNSAHPADLADENVWVGETEEAVCRVQVK